VRSPSEFWEPAVMRFALATLLFFNALCALGAVWMQLGDEPAAGSTALVSSVPPAPAPPKPITAPTPVETAPGSLPSTARAETETVADPEPADTTGAPPTAAPLAAAIVTDPAPVEAASSPPPATEPIAAATLSELIPGELALASPRQALDEYKAATVFESTPVETAPGAPSPKKPPVTERSATLPQPRPIAAVTVVNGSETPAKSITITSDEKAVSHAGPLAPRAKATVRVPKTKGCLVTVAATFEGGSTSEARAIDVCKVKLVRLTD
jgi:hypothetical protein